MAFHHSPKIVTDGLIVCLDAANPKSYLGSGTAWNDLAGSNYDATLEAGVTFQNNNLAFPAETEFADLDNPFGADNDMKTTPFTFETVVYPTSTGVWQMLARVRVLTSSKFGVKFILHTSNRVGVCFHRHDGSTSRSPLLASSSYPAPVNQWSHIAVTYDGSGTPTSSNQKVYFNGALISNASSAYSLTYMNDADTMRIAGRARSDQATWFFDGNMGFFRVYDRDLNATEVLQNYNAIKGRFGL